MTSIVTVATTEPSIQLKLSPCMDSWMFAMVAVAVIHGGGPAISLVKVKTIAPSSLVPLVATTDESTKASEVN